MRNPQHFHLSVGCVRTLSMTPPHWCLHKQPLPCNARCSALLPLTLRHSKSCVVSVLLWQNIFVCVSSGYFRVRTSVPFYSRLLPVHWIVSSMCLLYGHSPGTKNQEWNTHQQKDAVFLKHKVTNLTLLPFVTQKTQFRLSCTISRAQKVRLISCQTGKHINPQATPIQVT